MKRCSWFLIAIIAGSVICTIIVSPTGEGFVRGYNVVFTLVITSAIVWMMTLPAIAFMVWRWIKSKDFKGTIREKRQTATLVVMGLLVPLLNALIVTIKSALEYR